MSAGSARACHRGMIVQTGSVLASTPATLRSGTLSDEPHIADLYDAIPKVELHCHVEGSVRPQTVLELARKAGRTLAVEDPTQLYRYTFARFVPRDLLDDPGNHHRARGLGAHRIRVARGRGGPRPTLPRDVLHSGAPPRSRPVAGRHYRRGRRLRIGRPRRTPRCSTQAGRRHGSSLRTRRGDGSS